MQIFEVREKTTRKYTATLKDENGTAIAAASLSALKLTLYNLADGAIINARNAQNVLNVNGVTVDANGNLAWTLDPLDNPIVSTAAPDFEDHVALFEIEWSAGTKKNNHDLIIRIRNITKIA